MNERLLLRRALNDACNECGRCRGKGYLLIAGGSIACPTCGPWRRLLAMPRPPWWRHVWIYARHKLATR